MSQTEITGYGGVDPKTVVHEVWRVQASENVDEHSVLCAIDETAVESTERAIRNTKPLADFGEFGEVKEYKAEL
jgi:hypothetical protein